MCRQGWEHPQPSKLTFLFLKWRGRGQTRIQENSRTEQPLSPKLIQQKTPYRNGNCHQSPLGGTKVLPFAFTLQLRQSYKPSIPCGSHLPGQKKMGSVSLSASWPAAMLSLPLPFLLLEMLSSLPHTSLQSLLHLTDFCSRQETFPDYDHVFALQHSLLFVIIALSTLCDTASRQVQNTINYEIHCYFMES